MTNQTTIILTTDGASLHNQNENNREAAIGYLIEQDDEVVVEESKYLGQGAKYTNNFAEYQAVTTGVRDVKKQFGGERINLHIKSDSQLLIKQLAGEYGVNEMRNQYEECVEELSSLDSWQPEHVSQSPGNRVDRADKLAAKAFN